MCVHMGLDGMKYQPSGIKVMHDHGGACLLHDPDKSRSIMTLLLMVCVCVFFHST